MRAKVYRRSTSHLAHFRMSRSQIVRASMVLASSIRPSSTMARAWSHGTITVLSRSSSSRLGGPRFEIFAQEQIHAFGHDARRYVPIAEPADAARAIAGLLLELALGRLLGRLARRRSCRRGLRAASCRPNSGGSRPGRRARRRPSAQERRPRGGRRPRGRRASRRRAARIAAPDRSSVPDRSRGAWDADRSRDTPVVLVVESGAIGQRDRLVAGTTGRAPVAIADGQHGAGGFANDALGHRAQQHVAQAGSSVGGDDDQVDRDDRRHTKRSTRPGYPTGRP